MNGSKDNHKYCFIDTNIWLYAFIESQDTKKSNIAKSIIRRENIIISAQIINEVCVNLIKKAQFSEENIQELVTSFYEKYTVIDNCKKILIKASQLRKDNRFSFWDSIIIASALSSITSILYSEDMQDGFVVENKLRIENPFKNN